MEQQEYAAGARGVSGRTGMGRTGGAGQLSARASIALRPAVPAPARAVREGLDQPTATLRKPSAAAPAVAAPAVGVPAAVAPTAAAPVEPVPEPAGAAGALLPVAESLAARLAEADPGAAHDLFTAAFGLYGARHFGGVPDPSVNALPGTSWWHGPTAHSSAVRRARGGRPLRLRRGGRDAATAPTASTASVTAPRASGPSVTAPVASGPSVTAPASAPAIAPTTGRHRKPERARGAAQPAAAVERRTAARLLLAHPLVTAAGEHGAGFPLIRRHADWLAERFRAVLGYPLTVGADHARLHKAPLPGRSLPGFTPAAYAELVLALGAAADGLEPPPVRPEVLDVLTDWQVRRPEGAADRELAAALLTPRPLPADRVELTVRRLLAETPVVLLDELAPAERAWLLENRQREAELFAEFLGLEAEIRAEGVALLDPAGELTDLPLPGPGTIAGAALLTAERLVEELRPVPEAGAEAAPPAVLVPDALIDGALGDVIDDQNRCAGLAAAYLADRTAFRRDVLELLCAMHLIAPAGRVWVLRAPAARYAPQAELQAPPGSGRHSRPAPVAR